MTTGPGLRQTHDPAVPGNVVRVATLMRLVQYPQIPATPPIVLMTIPHIDSIPACQSIGTNPPMDEPTNIPIQTLFLLTCTSARRRGEGDPSGQTIGPDRGQSVGKRLDYAACDCMPEDTSGASRDQRLMARPRGRLLYHARLRPAPYDSGAQAANLTRRAVLAGGPEVGEGLERDRH
jgi:hypothetical protein